MTQHDLIHDLVKIETLVIKAREVAKKNKDSKECVGCESIYKNLTNAINRIVVLGDLIHSEGVEK